MMKRKYQEGMPSYNELIIPNVKALIELGGSGSVEEINGKVYEILQLSDDILEIPHRESGGNGSEVNYRLAWGRTYLRLFGLIENSSRGIWALTKPDINADKLNANEIVKKIREQTRPTKTTPKTKKEVLAEVTEETDEAEEWKARLLNVLYGISPAAFERLAQRLLRESGFFQVEVTRKSGDGGIDGKGIVRVSGLLSFPVIFQCKRYRGSITPSQIRDFRGAMQGRADKGLFITTGNFTREAIKEATRDGAPPIDLIDGDLLCDKMKELDLGVDRKVTETIGIKNEWFANL